MTTETMKRLIRAWELLDGASVSRTYRHIWLSIGALSHTFRRPQAARDEWIYEGSRICAPVAAKDSLAPPDVPATTLAEIIHREVVARVAALGTRRRAAESLNVGERSVYRHLKAPRPHSRLKKKEKTA